MKKYLSFFIAVFVMTCSLCVCSFGENDTAADNDKIQIVTTIFPEYDWVTNILGENPAGAEITMLLDNGVDLTALSSTMV